MELLLVIAFIVFVVGAVIGFVKRDWAPAFIASGLALVQVAASHLKIG